MTEKQLDEIFRRMEQRLIKYSKNLKATGHEEASVAAEAVREIFTQELYKP